MHDNSENLLKICDLIRECNVDADAIFLSMKLKKITQRVNETINDEKSLNELFDQFNKTALTDGDAFIDNLILVVTSKQLENLTIDGKFFRYSILTVCQKNYQNSDSYKKENLTKFYNSLKLLGGVFNKLRTAQGQTYNILGQSLLKMLNNELEKELKNVVHFKTDDFAKLILSQITLNGGLLHSRHSYDIEKVLFSSRKCLIEIDCLSSKSRAFLLMTLDLYYKNFGNLGEMLESMYKEFLVDTSTVNTNQMQPKSNTEVPVVDVKTEKSKVHESLEKLQITKSPQRKPYQPASPTKTPRSPLPQVTSPSPTGRRNPIPLRSSNKTAPPNRPQGQQHQRDVATKKPSPQSLRQRHSPPQPQSTVGSNQSTKKPQRTHFDRSPRRTNETPVPSSHQRNDRNRRSYTPNRQSHHNNSNGNHNNKHRVPQTSSPQETTRSEPSTPVKYKKQEITRYSPMSQMTPIENFSWVSDGEIDDLDKSASPKVQNPYTSSFLNFLAGGQ